ncbi:unnamed protein product [Adineta steineri]|uniref:Uncharacterized protein n=1 Tax=Adineta steineri TaxID=433720 RepID=A0A815HZ49_9BILA|nr:unnamed protein product [Adineta steineri]CAF1341238.1 unnamed protein product [Adineta steineri]CAF1356964.1 unnamed protein product [Adineta steineri]
MDVSATSSDDTLKKRYAELAEKTARAIADEGSPPNINDRPAIPKSLPPLPRYEPPTSTYLLVQRILQRCD